MSSIWSKILTYSNGTKGKIIDDGGRFQIHLHRYPGGLTISNYDKNTGEPARNFDGTPQRFTWPDPKAK